MNVIKVLLLIQCLTQADADLLNELERQMDWINEDPNASGILGCRKCTVVFKELSPAEQEFWLQNKDLTNDELLLIIQRLMITPKRIFEILDDNPNPGVEYSIESMRSAFVTLPKPGKRLLFHYYMDLNLDEDEVKKRLQNIYEKFYFTKGWQAYEKHVNELHDEGNPIFKIRAFESFKPNNQTYGNINYSSYAEKDEL